MLLLRTLLITGCKNGRRAAVSGVTVAGGNGTGSGANQFGYLLAIYVDSAGDVYAADNGVDGAPVGRVQKWASGAVTGVTVAGGHSSGWDVLSYPKGIALDNNGLIYVFDGVYNPRVQKYIPTNGKVDKTFSPSLASSYNLQAVLKNGCTATSNNLIVRATPEIYKIETTQPKGRGNLCSGGTDTFFVYAWDDVTDYTWKIPAACSLISNNNDSIVLSVPAGFDSGRLIVSGSNICGISEPDIIRLLGRPVLPGNIHGPKRVFSNQPNIVYSVDDINSNHNWLVTADAVIQSGQGTASILVNWGASAGTISVNSYNGCGATPLRRKAEILLKNNFVSGNEQATGEILSYKNDAFVFPNPAKNNATVKFNSFKQTDFTIQLQNMNGIILMQKNITAKQGSNTISFDISKFPSGIYVINIKNMEDKISLKLTKE